MCPRSWGRSVPRKDDVDVQSARLSQTRDDAKKKLPAVEPSFPQAELDWSFLKQGQLYGRDAELEQLRQVFHQRVGVSSSSPGNRNRTPNKKRPELVLVSGKSGTGKSVLVKRALRQLVEDERNGFFLLGKFDQLQNPEPYGSFVAALTQLVVSLESNNPEASLEGRECLMTIRQTILADVGLESCHVICALVPAFGRLLGLSYQASSPLKTHDAQRDRLKRALARR